MLRLVSIEFFKLRNSRYFWVLVALFVVILLAIPIAVKNFLDYLTSIGDSPLKSLGIDANQIPLFDFVDLWQNMTYIYTMFSLFLGFVIVISVCNDFAHGIIKQNVIDGMSRKEYFLSKVGFIVVLSATMSFAVFLIGLIVGFMWSPVTDVPFIFENIQFIPAYFLHLVVFQLFCMVIALLIKRSGIVLALLMFYSYGVEWIVTGIIEYHYKLPTIAGMFPIQAMKGIIPNPFPKFLLRETQNYIGMDDLGLLTGYGILFLWFAYWMLTKRDLS